MAGSLPHLPVAEACENISRPAVPTPSWWQALREVRALHDFVAQGDKIRVRSL